MPGQQKEIIPSKRVEAEEFLRELELAKDWLLWINPAIEEFELIVKDADGKVSCIHGPHPMRTDGVKYNQFIVSVRKITDAKEAKEDFC